jgi:hypothetical protein
MGGHGQEERAYLHEEVVHRRQQAEQREEQAGQQQRRVALGPSQAGALQGGREEDGDGQGRGDGEGHVRQQAQQHAAHAAGHASSRHSGRHVVAEGGRAEEVRDDGEEVETLEELPEPREQLGLPEE